MSTRDTDEGILSRWSKRKRAIGEEETVAEAGEEESQEELDAREAELLANQEAAEAIDLDTIDEESDLSLFLKEGVPEALKKAALAKLWRSNPIFANLDGLNDYDENFADPKLIMKTFTSAYQVGRGYLKEILEEESDPETAVVATNDDSELDEQTHVEEDAEIPVDSGNESSDVNEMAVLDEQLVEVEEIESLPKVSLRKRLNL